MTVLFDTSAIVAAHVLSHPQFAWADTQVKRADGLALCAHSMAECYGVLTGSPQFRLPPVQAVRLLEQLVQQWQVLPVLPEDYLRAARRCRDLGLSGGAVYDTLLAEVSLRHDVQTIVTLNPKHFRRLGEDVANLVESPF